MASDGRWYPPEQRPTAQAPSSPPTGQTATGYQEVNELIRFAGSPDQHQGTRASPTGTDNAPVVPTSPASGNDLITEASTSCRAIYTAGTMGSQELNSIESGPRTPTSIAAAIAVVRDQIAKTEARIRSPIALIASSSNATARAIGPELQRSLQQWTLADALFSSYQPPAPPTAALKGYESVVGSLVGPLISLGRLGATSCSNSAGN